MIAAIFLTVCLALAAAYFTHGRWIGRRLGVDPARVTPARSRNDGVATASVVYIGLAVLFGLLLYRLRLPLIPATALFVPLVFAGLWLGTRLPLIPDRIPVFLGSAKNTWNLVLLGYCFIASILPVWVLLQPRDYLSSFLLFSCLLGGGAGLIFSGATGAVSLNYPAFTGWSNPQLGFVFQEFFGIKGGWARPVATAATLAVPAVVIFITIKGPEGIPVPAWQAIWPAFGATNQLLASLALLVVFVWLRRSGRRARFILIPMGFILVATLAALAQLAWNNLLHYGNPVLGRSVWRWPCSHCIFCWALPCPIFCN